MVSRAKQRCQCPLAVEAFSDKKKKDTPTSIAGFYVTFVSCRKSCATVPCWLRPPCK